jgi:predicted small lipoprotein YifL
MRLRMILPLAALLALAACGNDGPDQTGSTNNANQPGNNAAPADPRSNPPPPAQ